MKDHETVRDRERERERERDRQTERETKRVSEDREIRRMKGENGRARTRNTIKKLSHTTTQE